MQALPKAAIVLRHPQSRGFRAVSTAFFFRPEKGKTYISKMHNQMNKYDLWIYKSTGKVSHIEARSQPANRL